jgi:hypothetical protein
MQNPASNQSDLDRFARRNNELREIILKSDPKQLAINTETIYKPKNDSEGVFEFTYWYKKVSFSYPDLILYDPENQKEFSEKEQAMILYYFNTANGAPLSEEWISFSELPDGMFYNQAFLSYTGKKLVQYFQNDKAGFERAALSLSGHAYPLGNAGFIFQVLPRISLLVVHWLGDEDFPPSFQVLFNAAAQHYMVTDGYAILGSILCGRLIHAHIK